MGALATSAMGKDRAGGFIVFLFLLLGEVSFDEDEDLIIAHMSIYGNNHYLR